MLEKLCVANKTKNEKQQASHLSKDLALEPLLRKEVDEAVLYKEEGGLLSLEAEAPEARDRSNRIKIFMYIS